MIEPQPAARDVAGVAMRRMLTLTTAAGCVARSPRSRSGECRTASSETAARSAVRHPHPASTIACGSASAWWRHELQNTSTRTYLVRSVVRAVGRPSVSTHQGTVTPGTQTMPRQPRRAVTYAEAMDALQQTYLTLLNILQLRLGQQTREQLELLRERLALVLRRDDGRRR
jgi:hypothetical protein